MADAEGAAAGGDPAAEPTDEELFAAWRTFFERISDRGVVAMVFEDLQWADDGLLEPRVYQTNPSRSEYVTTPLSRSLWPMLVAIWNWERSWVPDHRESLPLMRHTDCHGEFAPQVICRSCGPIPC